MSNTMLNIMWWGYGGSKHFAEALRPLIVSMGHNLTTMSEWPDSDIIWNRKTWLQELKKADVIIIPCNYKVQDCKSNNRLTQALSIGKPVICNPLPAYLKVLVRVLDCCLIAETEEEWKKQIKFLEDPFNRSTISKRALIAASFYSIEEIAEKWRFLIEDYSKAKKPIWLAPYNLEACQTRIRVIAVQEYLKHSLTQSYLDAACNHDLVVVGKSFSELDYINIKTLKSIGVTVFADLCEDLIGWPWVNEILDLCDLVVCCSYRLEEKVKLINNKTTVIEDAFERE